ncbi:conserved membrane hypothetical protein [Candidatus Terasakiella magnetica]|nr:conserved membrane hypothetical protein [Candidatus Terasakiella magnetica]
MTSSRNKRGLAGLAVAALGVAYPFLVYIGIGWLPPGALVLAALALVAARLMVLRGSTAARALIPPLVLVGLSILAISILDAALAARVYPVFMSLGMAAAFGLSLLRPPSLVEVFARLSEPEPGGTARAYMRRVSLVWCVFLVVNALISASTLSRLDLWTLYNGLVSYLLMAALFAGEYLVRRRVRAEV